VKVESAETGGAFAFIEYTLNAWEGPPPHVHHAGSETFYVLEGTLQMLVGKEPVSVTPGMCVHVPAGAVHTFSNPYPGTVRVVQIVSPGSLLTMIEEVSALVQSGIVDRSQIAAIFRRHESEVVAG
jgi:mannose-6-phosphate isomerase-like protein (cupin superfamily)